MQTRLLKNVGLLILFLCFNLFTIPNAFGEDEGIVIPESYIYRNSFEATLCGEYTNIDFEGIVQSGNYCVIYGNEFDGLILSEPLEEKTELFVGIPVYNDFWKNFWDPVNPVNACLAPDSESPQSGVIWVDFDSPVGGVGVNFLNADTATSKLEIFGPGFIWAGRSVAGGSELKKFVGFTDPLERITSAKLTIGVGDDTGAAIDDLIFGQLIVKVDVFIDIKPGSSPNTINLGSNGVIPVAILSSADFDATIEVDRDTVELAGAGVAVRGKNNKLLAHEEDVNDDGWIDLVCQIETENLDPGTFQDGQAVLTGNLLSGSCYKIEGRDEITIVPPGE